MKYSKWRKRKVAKDRKESIKYDDSIKLPVSHTYSITPKFNKTSGFKMSGLGFGGFKMDAGKSFKPTWMNKQEKDSEEAMEYFNKFMTDAKWKQLYKKFPNCEDEEHADFGLAVVWIIQGMEKKYGNKIDYLLPEITEIITNTLM